MKLQSWLWPDRRISKIESRALREDHNAMINHAHEACEMALERVLADWPVFHEPPETTEESHAMVTVAKLRLALGQADREATAGGPDA